MRRKKVRKSPAHDQNLCQRKMFCECPCARCQQEIDHYALKDEAPGVGPGASGVDTDGVLPASSDLHPEDSPPRTMATSGTVDFCTVCGGQHDRRDPQPH